MIKIIIITICSSLFCVSAWAIPVLQLGPDGTGGNYDTDSQTWLFDATSASFSFNAYNLNSGTAYLVFASVPGFTTDVFDISVSGDSGLLSLYDSGYGTPPFEDPNSLAPHGIYDTWSEIYEINFDTAATVFNTQPGEPGSAAGYSENILVNILSADAGLSGIHIDLFTADWNAANDKKIVTDFAPFSHDAQLQVVPVPAAVWLMGSGLLALAGIARRRR